VEKRTVKKKNEREKWKMESSSKRDMT